jgi:hypothetical protein
LNMNASTTINDCIFSNNYSSTAAGGLFNFGASPTINRTIFSGNLAYLNGGGIINQNGSPTYVNCVITSNITKEGNGGGMWNYNATSKLINCTINRNRALTSFVGVFGNGGGIYNTTTTSTLINCLFTANQAGRGNDVYQDEGSMTTFFYCNILYKEWYGTPWDTHLGMDGGGNIMSDPRYLDYAYPVGTDGIWKTKDDGLRIQAGSACINVGTPSGAPTDDITGNQRIDAPDIGAYEYQIAKNGADVWMLYR